MTASYSTSPRQDQKIYSDANFRMSSSCKQFNRLFNLLIGLSRAAENKNKKDTFDLNATIELSCTRFKYEWQVIKRGFVFKARVRKDE